ncbi:MAG: hypothetical protein JRN68_06405 [Nitrososphaerota archaeon]|nr:hypothetical protein [Nitrososphaerota archaeon]
MSDDAAGVVLIINHGSDKNVKVVTIKSGYARGGYSHAYPESFFVVAGELTYFSGSEKDHEERKVTAGSRIQTVSGVPHMFIAQEDSVLFEITPVGDYHADAYAPWRKIVKDLMKY